MIVQGLAYRYIYIYILHARYNQFKAQPNMDDSMQDIIITPQHNCTPIPGLRARERQSLYQLFHHLWEVHHHFRQQQGTVPFQKLLTKSLVVSLQLAGNLLPQEIYPGVSVTSISGMLSSKNNKHVLHPHPVAVGKQLWGQTSVEATIQALREVNKFDVHTIILLQLINGRRWNVSQSSIICRL